MTTSYVPKRIEVIVNDRHFATVTILQPMWRIINKDKVRKDLILKYPELENKHIKLIQHD